MFKLFTSFSFRSVSRSARDLELELLVLRLLNRLDSLLLFFFTLRSFATGVCMATLLPLPISIETLLLKLVKKVFVETSERFEEYESELVKSEQIPLSSSLACECGGFMGVVVKPIWFAIKC